MSIQVSSQHSKNCRKEALLSVDGRSNLTPLWSEVAALLGVALAVDALLCSHPLLQEHWTSYVKTVELVQANPAKLGLSPEQLKPLERQILARLGAALFSRSVALNALQAHIPAVESGQLNSAGLLADLAAVLPRMIEVWERKADSGWNNAVELPGLVGLTALQATLFPRSPDRKALKLLWDAAKKAPRVPLQGWLLFQPAKFLQSVQPPPPL